VALFFIAVAGGGKLSNDPHNMWIAIFARIGLGQWFRYATGAIQMAGGILLLVPRTLIIGTGMLACTMAGAVVAQLAVFHSPGAALIPGALLIVIVAVGWKGWSRARVFPSLG
jgi:hypothetical protein